MTARLSTESNSSSPRVTRRSLASRNRVGGVYVHAIGLVRQGFVSVRDAKFEHVGGDSSEGNDATGGLLVIQQKPGTRYHSTRFSSSATTGIAGRGQLDYSATGFGLQ